MRRGDKVGRIVIPLELREKYGLSEGVEIEFIDGNQGITIRASEAVCKICRNKISPHEKLPLCDKCVEEVIKATKQNKL